jgi:hypothetical protein
MPVGLPFAALCLTCLPRREVPITETWIRQFPRSSLSLKPGVLHLQTTDGRTEQINYGLPFGAWARILIFYFWRQVTRTGHREIERSMSYRRYLEFLGIPSGGKSYLGLREQAQRIFGCRLILAFCYGAVSGVFEESLVEGGSVYLEERDGRLRCNSMLLGQRLFESMRDHPMPMLDSTIRQISHQPFAMDVYCWLACLLPHLQDETVFSWSALHTYFGAGYTQLRHFKLRIAETLAKVLQLYPRATARVDQEADIILKPSPAPK